MTSCLDLAPIASLKDATILCVNSVGNVKLRAALFTPLKEGNRGTICLFSGRTEYIEKYEEVITELRQRGFMVAALDWRGQGGSSRLLAHKLKGHVKHYKDYDADLKAFYEEVVSKSCPKPYYALSHSMGGLILMRSALQNQPYFDKYIFSSPFIGLPKGAGSVVGKILAAILNGLSLGENFIPFAKVRPSFEEPFVENKLTTDEKRYNKMAEIGKIRPDLFIGAPTIGWVHQSVETQGEIEDTPASAFKQVPMLFCVAMKDQIVSPEATLKLASRLKNATIKRLETSQHEALIEVDSIRKEFWDAFDTFMA